MFDYSPINTYPCTPPGAATNIKKNLVHEEEKREWKTEHHSSQHLGK